MLAGQTEAETTMAVHRATGLPFLQAREFIRTSPPNLIERILTRRQIRCATYLAALPTGLSERIQDAAEVQAVRQSLNDPIEYDAALVPTVRMVPEQAERQGG